MYTIIFSSTLRTIRVTIYLPKHLLFSLELTTCHRSLLLFPPSIPRLLFSQSLFSSFSVLRSLFFSSLCPFPLFYCVFFFNSCLSLSLLSSHLHLPPFSISPSPSLASSHSSLTSPSLSLFISLPPTPPHLPLPPLPPPSLSLHPPGEHPFSRSREEVSGGQRRSGGFVDGVKKGLRSLESPQERSSWRV